MHTYSDVLCTKSNKKLSLVKGKRYPLVQITEKYLVIMQDSVGVKIPVEYFI